MLTSIANLAKILIITTIATGTSNEASLVVAKSDQSTIWSRRLLIRKRGRWNIRRRRNIVHWDITKVVWSTPNSEYIIWWYMIYSVCCKSNTVLKTDSRWLLSVPVSIKEVQMLRLQLPRQMRRNLFWFRYKEGASCAPPDIPLHTIAFHIILIAVHRVQKRVHVLQVSNALSSLQKILKSDDLVHLENAVNGDWWAEVWKIIKLDPNKRASSGRNLGLSKSMAIRADCPQYNKDARTTSWED
jgi:hypothetical protein